MNQTRAAIFFRKLLTGFVAVVFLFCTAYFIAVLFFVVVGIYGYFAEVSRPTAAAGDIVLLGYVEPAVPVQPASSGRSSQAQGSDNAVAAPFGIELGQGRCADIAQSLPIDSTIKNAWGDPVLSVSDSIGKLNTKYLKTVYVVCDNADTVISVSLTFHKKRRSTIEMQAMSHELDQRYAVLDRVWPEEPFPNGNNVFARWQANNARIEMEYFIMDYGFDLRYFDYQADQADQAARQWLADAESELAGQEASSIKQQQHQLKKARSIRYPNHANLND